MKYYVITGEASGDLHGANLIHHIFSVDSSAQIRAWGGNRMQNEGATIVKSIDEMSFMGFWEVATSLNKILKLLSLCKKDLKSFNPDVVILIDYPGFNLRIAKYAKSIGLKVVYYISPQVWAWHRSRVYDIKKYVDVMIPILPFEKDFYRQYDVNVEYYGHPLVDEIEKHRRTENKEFRDSIAVLPGSRRSEIERMLPIFADVARKMPTQNFTVAAMSNIGIEYYNKILQNHIPDNMNFAIDCTYDILSNAKAGIITSGTATLETAIFGLPQVVCYKTNPITYKIARYVAKIKYISLVNLILDKPLLTELIQHDCNSCRIVEELRKITEDEAHITNMREGYSELLRKLNKEGVSKKIATAIVEGLV